MTRGTLFADLWVGETGIHTMAVFQRLAVAGFWGRGATVRSLLTVSGVLEEASGPVLTLALDVYLARRTAAQTP